MLKLELMDVVDELELDDASAVETDDEVEVLEDFADDETFFLQVPGAE